MKQKLAPGQKIICLNRKASFNYFFLEILEAGITLKGSEVKSLRDGKGSIAMDGMVAAWYYDGHELVEPLVLEKSRIIVLAENHPEWPFKKGGIIASHTAQEYSMGLNAEEDEFWVKLDTDYGKFDLIMFPWNPAMSSLKVAQSEYGLGMGYGISRLHGSICKGKVGEESVNGTASVSYTHLTLPTNREV